MIPPDPGRNRPKTTPNFEGNWPTRPSPGTVFIRFLIGSKSNRHSNEPCAPRRRGGAAPPRPWRGPWPDYPRPQPAAVILNSYLDSKQETKMYILFFPCFWPVSGQSWAQEPAQRPRFEKRYINQRKLPRETKSSFFCVPKADRQSIPTRAIIHVVRPRTRQRGA